MDSPFSFRETNMVFHAPLHRRQGVALRPTATPYARPEPRATRTEPIFPGRRFHLDDRAFSPLPALPTMLRAQSHVRVMPTAEVSPVHGSYRSQPDEITTLRPPGKGSLGFILGDSRTPIHASRPVAHRMPSSDRYYDSPRQHDYIHDPIRDSIASDGSLTPLTHASHSSPSALRHASVSTQNATHLLDAAAPIEKKKRKARICTTEGCTKYVVDHGLCIRHGGGKRCYIDGCDCRAQNRGLCWKHGGFTICKVEGCSKRAKSRGICWSHGGGTRCKRDDCSKIAVSNGLCWAHGGGKRCVFGKCRKPASERTNNYCNEHFAMEDNGSFEDSA